MALSLAWPTVAAWLIAGWRALAWLAYAVALAIWGRYLAPWWTAALQLPRYGVGAMATAESLRRRAWEVPWTTSQRVGLLLAVGQVSAAVTGLWPTWDKVRLGSAAIYVVIGWVVWREPR